MRVKYKFIYKHLYTIKYIFCFLFLFKQAFLKKDYEPESQSQRAREPEPKFKILSQRARAREPKFKILKCLKYAFSLLYTSILKALILNLKSYFKFSNAAKPKKENFKFRAKFQIPATPKNRPPILGNTHLKFQTAPVKIGNTLLYLLPGNTPKPILNFECYPHPF